MRRQPLILLLVATLLFAGDQQSTLKANPAKGRRNTSKNIRNNSSRLSNPVAKPKPASRPPKLSRTPRVRSAGLPGSPSSTLIPAPLPSKPLISIPAPGSTLIPAPLPSTPPLVITPAPLVVTPMPIPPVIVAPPVVIRPRLPRVSISIGSLRPVRRTYLDTRVVTVQEAQPVPARIVKIIDTTHVLVLQAGQTRKVRLLGLDAVTSVEVYPEVHRAAVAYMKKEFEGETVYLDFDSSVGSEDQAGTQIAYVYRSEDKQLLNEAVIENGFALAAVTYEYDQKVGFKVDQAKAEKLNSGVWSQVSIEGS